MLRPDPPNLPSWIILIPCQPQITLFANDIENLARDVSQVRIPGLAACAVNVKFEHAGSEEEDFGGLDG